MTATATTTDRSNSPPPDYSPPTTATEANYGFPPGYFVIRSCATGRLFDVELDSTLDGAEIILWPEKETSLVEGLRRPGADNQVFFIDTTGALCSRHSGHAVDIIGSRLVLRHRRPVSYPYPNAFSHPLPHFWYSASTKQIHIRFLCDPSFPHVDPSEDTSSHQAWQQRAYLLSSVPVRKPRTFMDDAAEAFTSFTSNPLSPLQSIFSLPVIQGSKSQADDVRDSDIDLREDELMEEDRGENEEADDSPELMRKIRMVSIDNLSASATEATKLRRSFEVIPLRRGRAHYSR